MEKEHLEIILEQMNSKFGIVIEGHQTLHQEIMATRADLSEKFNFLNFKIDTVNENLSKRIDAVETKLDAVETKLDAVASDLKAHREDTEVHSVYQVKEN